VFLAGEREAGQREPGEKEAAMSTPDEAPTERQPARWVGSAAVPEGEPKRRLRTDDTLDLPIEERVPPPPEIRYVPVPVPAYGPPPGYQPLRYQPPGYPAPGYGPPPVFKRRRRKWPWVLLFSMLLCAGCCGGCYALTKPFSEQYPATATTTAAVTGLTIVEDAAARRTADRLRPAIDTGQLDEVRFTVVYADQRNRQSRITVFGTTRFVADPRKDLNTALGKLADELKLTGLRKVDAGELGGEQRCGTGRLDGTAVALCAGGDHGSIGVALFAGRGIEASSPVMQSIRATVIVRG
jgi:hypothetical protein